MSSLARGIFCTTRYLKRPRKYIRGSVAGSVRQSVDRYVCLYVCPLGLLQECSFQHFFGLILPPSDQTSLLMLWWSSYKINFLDSNDFKALLGRNCFLGFIGSVCPSICPSITWMYIFCCKIIHMSHCMYVCTCSLQDSTQAETQSVRIAAWSSFVELNLHQSLALVPLPI